MPSISSPPALVPAVDNPSDTRREAHRNLSTALFPLCKGLAPRRHRSRPSDALTVLGPCICFVLPTRFAPYLSQTAVVPFPSYPPPPPAESLPMQAQQLKRRSRSARLAPSFPPFPSCFRHLHTRSRPAIDPTKTTSHPAFPHPLLFLGAPCSSGAWTRTEGRALPSVQTPLKNRCLRHLEPCSGPMACARVGFKPRAGFRSLSFCFVLCRHLFRGLFQDMTHTFLPRRPSTHLSPSPSSCLPKPELQQQRYCAAHPARHLAGAPVPAAALRLVLSRVVHSVYAHIIDRQLRAKQLQRGGESSASH